MSEPSLDYRLGLCLGAMRAVAEIIEWNEGDDIHADTAKGIVAIFKAITEEVSLDVVLEEEAPTVRPINFPDFPE